MIDINDLISRHTTLFETMPHGLYIYHMLTFKYIYIRALASARSHGKEKIPWASALCPKGQGQLNEPAVPSRSAKSGSGTIFRVLKNVFARAHYIKIQ